MCFIFSRLLNEISSIDCLPTQYLYLSTLKNPKNPKLNRSKLLSIATWQEIKNPSLATRQVCTFPEPLHYTHFYLRLTCFFSPYAQIQNTEHTFFTFHPQKHYTNTKQTIQFTHFDHYVNTRAEFQKSNVDSTASVRYESRSSTDERIRNSFATRRTARHPTEKTERIAQKIINRAALSFYR